MAPTLKTSSPDYPVPIGLHFDTIHRKLYWTDFRSDSIHRANPDGTDLETVINSGSANTSQGGCRTRLATKLYWSDVGTKKIQRANLDGSAIEDLITTGLSLPQSIALDITNNKIYWTDFGTKKIQRANLDGTAIEDLVTTGLLSPHRSSPGSGAG